MRKFTSIVILVAFISTSIKSPAYAQVASNGQMPWMPKPGVMVPLSPEFVPSQLTGITIHPDNALQFDFLINKGDEVLANDQKKEEYKKLVKYFLASLTIPDDDQWVNLSPYEKNRIVQDNFGKTQMGRDLLAEDYMLKQITASLIYPERGLGKKFWDKIYQRAWNEYHTTNIPVNTFNKVWIMPDEAMMYESGNTAYIMRSHLKVMLEEDYLSLSKHTAITNPQPTKVKEVNKIGSLVVREIVLPALEQEVNEGKNFATLRQMYSGMILATWYKKDLRESLLGEVYANKAKVKGVDQDPRSNEIIYQRYLRAFKKGVFNYIKEDTDKYTNETVPRKYFSGGFERDHAMLIDYKDSVNQAKYPSGLPTGAIVVIRPSDLPNMPADEREKVLAALKPVGEVVVVRFNPTTGEHSVVQNTLGETGKDEAMTTLQKIGLFIGIPTLLAVGVLSYHQVTVKNPNGTITVSVTNPNYPNVATEEIKDNSGNTIKVITRIKGKVVRESTLVKKSPDGTTTYSVKNLTTGVVSEQKINNKGRVIEESTPLTAESARFIPEKKSTLVWNPNGTVTVTTTDLTWPGLVTEETRDALGNVVSSRTIIDGKVVKENTLIKKNPDGTSTYSVKNLLTDVVFEQKIDQNGRVIEEATHSTAKPSEFKVVSKTTLVKQNPDGTIVMLVTSPDYPNVVTEETRDAFGIIVNSRTIIDGKVVRESVLVRKNPDGTLIYSVKNLTTDVVTEQIMGKNGMVIGETKHLAKRPEFKEVSKTTFKQNSDGTTTAIITKPDNPNMVTEEIRDPFGSVLNSRTMVNGKVLRESTLIKKNPDGTRTYSVKNLTTGVVSEQKMDENGRLIEETVPLSQPKGQTKDKASVNETTPLGGIDFNAANLAMTIKRDGKGVPLPLAQQDMAQLSHIQGFEPEILEIKSGVSFPIVSDLQQKLRTVANVS